VEGDIKARSKASMLTQDMTKNRPIYAECSNENCQQVSIDLIQGHLIGVKPCPKISLKVEVISEQRRVDEVFEVGVYAMHEVKRG